MEGDELKKLLRASRFGSSRVPSATLKGTDLHNQSVRCNISPLAPDGQTSNAAWEAPQEWGGQPEAIVGTCEEMCPAIERERRSRLNDIQVFERVDPHNPAVTSPELAVKRFARTIDDTNNAPEFFRTRSALRLTMAHLRNLLDREDVRLGLIHKFLWDRYRSVRQDLYIQGIDDEFAVEVFEEVVRFHLLSEHALCEEEASITEMEGFNSHLNMEQMNKALISLGDMYNKLATAGREIASEPEFRAYHLLSLMGQHGKFKGDSQAFLSMLQGMRLNLQQSAPVQWVLQLQRAFSSGNFVRFFVLVRQAPYLLACLAHIYFDQVRGRALHTLAESMPPKSNIAVAVKLTWLMDVLMLDSEEEAKTLCSRHGFSATTHGSASVVLLVKGGYIDPPPPVPRKRSLVIARKAPSTRSEAVTTPSLLPVTAPSAKDSLELKESYAKRCVLQHSEPISLVATGPSKSDKPEGHGAGHRNLAKMGHEEVQLQPSVSESHEQALYQADHNGKQRIAGKTQQHSSAMQTEPQGNFLQQASAVDEHHRESGLQNQVPGEPKLQLGDHYLQQQAASEAVHWQRENQLQQQAAEAANLLREDQRRQAAIQLELEVKEQRLHFLRRFYFDRWRSTAQRRCLERYRHEGRAVDLKACTVGFQKAMSCCKTSEYLLGMELTSAAAIVSRMQSPISAKSNEWTDLYSCLQQMQQEHSSVDVKYWKLVIAPLDSVQSSDSVREAAAAQQLYTWLTLQLRRGTPSTAPSGISYWEDASPNCPQGPGTASMALLPTVRACFTFPKNEAQFADSLAGASGIVLVVSNGEAIPEVLDSRLSNQGPHLPVLLLAASDGVANLLRQHVKELGSEALQAIHIADPLLASPTHMCAGSNIQWPVYSQRALVHGLQWLATKAPQQPSLQITSLETALRLAFAATSMSLQGTLDQKPRRLHAAQLVCAAFREAVALIIDAARQSHQSKAAAWQWPPPEMAPAALRRWYDMDRLHMLINILLQLKLEAASLLEIASGCDLHALLVAANALLAAFNPAAPCLVTPFDLRDFLAGRLGKFRLVHTTKATGSFYRHQHLLQADTTHSKRKRQGDGLIAPPCAPVAFRLADISTGSPGACSGTLPLWQQLQQALALEENETCDFNKIASFAV